MIVVSKNSTAETSKTSQQYFNPRSLKMNDRLNRCAQDGNIESLYSILAQDPHILDRIDATPIIHTPLHIAATFGNTHFAMELATLKPSLARKLNHHGFSPVHLALENGQDQLVRSIMTVDPELLRVKSKGRVTPLHYVAAEMENKVDLLAEFLSVCPSAVGDLTVRCETAVHVAVKNKRFGAFKVLFGWLRRVNKEEILNWKDEDGNTVLHIATSTNQPEVVKLLIKDVNLNAKNLSGLTAMDICDLQKDLLDEEVRRTLSRAKAKRAFEFAHGSTFTLAEYLCGNLSLIEKRDKYLRLISQTSSKTSESDLRNIVLVVAILIATATYQAVLSPPGGFWQDTNNPPPNNTMASGIDSSQQPHWAGQMVMPVSTFFHFFTLNTIAFYVSAFTILIVIMGLPYCAILSTSISFLLSAYQAAVSSTYAAGQPWAVGVFMIIIYALAMLTTIVPIVVSVRHRRHQGRVDPSKRHIGGGLI